MIKTADTQLNETRETTYDMKIEFNTLIEFLKKKCQAGIKLEMESFRIQTKKVRGRIHQQIG